MTLDPEHCVDCRDVQRELELEAGPGIINFAMDHGPIFMAEPTFVGASRGTTTLKAVASD